MKPEQFFIGDIKQCIKYDICNPENIMYKKNAVLLKLKNGAYVDVERINSFLDFLDIYKDIRPDCYRIRPHGLMMSIHPSNKGYLFVDDTTLRPYFNKEEQVKNISVRKLKKEIKL